MLRQKDIGVKNLAVIKNALSWRKRSPDKKIHAFLKVSYMSIVFI